MDSHKGIKWGKSACIRISNYTFRFREHKMNVLLFGQEFLSPHLLLDFSSIEKIEDNVFYRQSHFTEKLRLEFEANLVQQNPGQLLAKKFIKLQLHQYHQRQDLLVSKHTRAEYPRLSAGQHLQHHRQEDSEGWGRNHQQNSIICRISAPHNSKSLLQLPEAPQHQGWSVFPKAVSSGDLPGYSAAFPEANSCQGFAEK